MSRAVDRTQPPPVGAPRPWRPPSVDETLLGNGLRLYLAVDRSVPLVSVQLVLPGGASLDPPGAPGTASLCSALLTEGTERHDAGALAKRIDRLGASLGAGATADAVVARVAGLGRTLPELVDLLAETVRRPVFPEADVERVRGIRLDSLRQMRDSPAQISADRFAAILFAGTPYAEPVAGTLASVAALGREALATFHRRTFAPGGAALVVSGDFDPAVVLRLVEEAFGDWSGRVPATPEIAPTRPAGTRTVLVDRPASVQSTIRIGHPSVPRHHPDWPVLQVLNAILGGKFTSRVNLNLRERHGYTYGASTRFEPRLWGGPFVAAADVQNGATAPSVTELLSELRRIREEPVEPAELDDAKAYLDGVFPYLLETADDLASRLVDRVTFRLPPDHLETWRGQVAAVTREAVLRGARERIDVDRALVLVVGKADEVAGPLSELGPLETMDIDGNRIA